MRIRTPLLQCGFVLHGALGAQPDVAVHVHQSGQDVAVDLGGSGAGVGIYKVSLVHPEGSVGTKRALPRRQHRSAQTQRRGPSHSRSLFRQQTHGCSRSAGSHASANSLIHRTHAFSSLPGPPTPLTTRLLERCTPWSMDPVAHRPRNFSNPAGRFSDAGSTSSDPSLPAPKAAPLGALGPCAARSAASRSCCARLAGLPDLPLFFFFGGAMRPLDFFPPPGSPPAPGIPPIPGMPRPPFWDIERIIVFACSNRSSRPLISLTVVPDPLAMRERREPLMIFGFDRSAGVIDCTMASMRVTSDSSKFSSCSRICPIPGSISSIFFIGPSFFSCCIWDR